MFLNSFCVIVFFFLRNNYPLSGFDMRVGRCGLLHQTQLSKGNNH